MKQETASLSPHVRHNNQPSCLITAPNNFNDGSHSKEESTKPEAIDPPNLHHANSTSQHASQSHLPNYKGER
eukprot:4599250-Ditylum_brightwellii.AAC.1